MNSEKDIIKSFKINSVRLIVDYSLAILISPILLYLVIYFNVISIDNLRGLIYLVIIILVIVFGLFTGIFRGISKIEFDRDILRIIYHFNRKKTIGFSKIKDVSFGNNYLYLYYIDKLKPEKILLIYFSRNDRKKIVEIISEIMNNKFMNYTEEELEELYGDKN